jgi:hypothetical protein
MAPALMTPNQIRSGAGRMTIQKCQFEKGYGMTWKPSKKAKAQRKVKRKAKR